MNLKNIVEGFVFMNDTKDNLEIQNQENLRVYSISGIKKVTISFVVWEENSRISINLFNKEILDEYTDNKYCNYIKNYLTYMLSNEVKVIKYFDTKNDIVAETIFYYGANLNGKRFYYEEKFNYSWKSYFCKPKNLQVENYSPWLTP